MYRGSGDRGADRLLRPFEANLEDARAAPDERERSTVVARGERTDLRDSGRARVVEEHARESGADAAVLMLVCDREGDLRRLPPGADELRDRGGPRVSDDVGDERVMGAVDARQLLQVGGAEARLRGVEAPAAGLGS